MTCFSELFHVSFLKSLMFGGRDSFLRTFMIRLRVGFGIQANGLPPPPGATIH